MVSQKRTASEKARTKRHTGPSEAGQRPEEDVKPLARVLAGHGHDEWGSCGGKPGERGRGR
jgi:hypothetical protein